MRLIDDDLSAHHISLYNALFLIWNECGFDNELSINRNDVMKLSKIGSANTYTKALKELDEKGYIKYIPSNNPLKGSKVNLYRFDKGSDKGTVKSSSKGTDKGSDKGSDKACDTLYKQVNNETPIPLNNETNRIDLIFPFETDNFKNTWNQFIEFRKSIKKPLKEISQQAQLLKLSKFTENDATEMILQSIANGWQGIFEIKNNTQNGKSNHNMEQKPTDNPLIGRIRAKDLAEFMRPRHNNQSNQS